MEETYQKNPKKRKISSHQENEEVKEENKENDEPFSFYSLLNIEKTASLEEIVFEKSY